jgi:hypothetical protein
MSGIIGVNRAGPFVETALAFLRGDWDRGGQS